MRTIEVYPAIVWTTDPRAEALVEAWGPSLGKPWGLFIRHARTPAEARAIAREYNRLEFEEYLREEGVNLAGESATCTLRIAVVAAVDGEDSLRQRAEEVQRARRKIEEVVGVDAFHWILVADQLDDLPGRGIDSVPGLPWLVTRFTSNFRELSDEKLTRWIGDLLLMVVGIDASRAAAGDPNIQRFHHPASSGKGYVRLVGYPRRSLDHVFEQLVGRSLLLLQGQLDRVAPRTRQVAEVRREVERQARLLAGVGVELRDFLDAVFGPAGLGGLDLPELARDGIRLLKRCEAVLERFREGEDPAEREGDDRQTVQPLGWLQRLIAWLGRLVGLDLWHRPPVPPPERAPAEVVEEALKRLEEGRTFLEDWAEGPTRDGFPATLPPNLVDDWNATHLETVRKALRMLARGSSGAEKARGVWADVEEMVRRGLVERLSEVLQSDEGAREAVGAVVRDVQGRGMHYSAPLKGGQSPPRAGLLTTLPGSPFEEGHENAASLALGTAPRLVVMGYTDPVGIEQVGTVSWDDDSEKAGEGEE